MPLDYSTSADQPSQSGSASSSNGYGSVDQIVDQATGQPTYDPKQVVDQVNQRFSAWRQFKRPMEVQWFVNSANLRGLHTIRWNNIKSRLETENLPTYKLRPPVNKILPKFRMRKAKFLRTPYTPIVVPATGNYEDTMDANASQKALEYVSRAAALNQVYAKAVDWAVTTGKGFVWVYWDPTKTAQMSDPLHQGQATTQQVGDVCLEAGSPFEVLVPDMGLETIGEQPEFIRARVVSLDELKLQYQDNTEVQALKGDTGSEDLFQYQKQIATLANRSNVGLVASTTEARDRKLNYIIKKELFQKPCISYPNGRYIVVAGGVVLRYQEVLPYNFGPFKNPYPIVEFPDIPLPGQFWPTSTVEQLTGPQQEYADYRSRLYNHIEKQSHPKIITSTFNKWPANAWTDKAGEVIQIITPPGVPPVQVITPPPINGDLWRALELTSNEMDAVVSLSVPLMTDTQGMTSGFQVNQMVEANDSVHAPDIALHADAMVELYHKMRKIMAQGYQLPRLVNISGRNHIPDMVEFSKDNIDENADIVVYTGSALSNSPAVRTQQVIELWNSGILQNPQDPQEAQRKALGMLDAQGIGEFQQELKADEDKARLENINIERNEMVNPPLPFDNHQVHYQMHTLQTKQPSFDQWPPNLKQELYAHILMHCKYINPQQAMQLAADLGMPPEIYQYLQTPPVPGQAPPQDQQQGPPPPQQHPAQQNPQPPPPPPPEQ